MRAFIASLTFVLATVFAGASASAQEVITVSTWASPSHGINAIVWPTWKKWIEEATDGRVTLEVVADLGPPQAQMDLVADGVGDASWIFHGHMPGRFTLTQLPEFSVFEEFPSELAAAAYWRAHQKYLAEANEHREVVVMGVGVHGPGQLFMGEGVDSLADAEGKRVRIGGGVMADVAERVGVQGTAIPPTETYQALSQGVVSGAFFTPEALRSFRVAEVTDNILKAPGGFYRGSFAIILNRDKWMSISEKDREAIMAVSGERLSRLFGYMMDHADEHGYAFGQEQGMKVHELTDAELERVRGITADLQAEWVNEVSDMGVDGEAALQYFRDQLAELEGSDSIAPQTVNTAEQ